MNYTCVRTMIFALISAPAAVLAQTHSILPLLPPAVSTVPSNGDVNPYGVAFVPRNVIPNAGLQSGDILVSNFNSNLNLQGMGTTIVRVNNAGTVTTFFTSANRGLTAALGVLTNGMVLVGNISTLDGTPATIIPGQVSVISPSGIYMGSLGAAGAIKGPWGMAVYDTGTNGAGTAHVFVSDTLQGTVTRFDVSYSPAQMSVTNTVVLADGLNHRLDPAALLVGPAGMVYSASNDTLYFANSDDGSIYKIPQAVAGTSTTTAAVFIQDGAHLHGPIGLAILPDGHLLVSNGDGTNVDPNQPSELVEYTATGTFLAEYPVDPNNAGAFGIGVLNYAWAAVRVAAVDDNANALKIWTTVIP